MPFTVSDRNQTFDKDGKLVEENVVQRDVTNEVVLLQIHDKLRAALGSNQTFLGINSPTASQQAAQLKALTRQVNALIRMIAKDLLVESTDT